MDGAMGFKESLKYGMATCLDRRAEQRVYEERNRLSNSDLVIPSVLGVLPEITPSLARAALTTQIALLKMEGAAISENHEALLAQANKEAEQRTRFSASKWSKLFPMLKIETKNVIKI